VIGADTSHPPGLSSIAELIAQRAGIAFGPHSGDALIRASRRVMARHTLTDLDQLAARLQADPACFASLLDEVTVGETYFFRNPEHFELVRTALLPGLRAMRGAQHVLQIWSAGCATGEEAYSLAMLLDGEGLLDRARVVASDIAPTALTKARAARYREWSLRGLDPSIARRWLLSDGDGAHVCERIRRSVQFRSLNLAEPCYPSPQLGIGQLDLIFCRNVLIYFDAATIAAVERRLFAALAPGGFLIVGPSDPMPGKHAPFEVRITEHGMCYSRPSVPASDLERSARVGFGSAPPAHTSAPAPEPAPPAERSTAVPPARGAPSAEPEASVGPAGEGGLAEQVRASWRERGAGDGLHACERALQRESMSPELHYLHAVLLLDLARESDALAAARRALYLDGSLAIVQFTLGTILERAGRPDAARRPYRNAYEATAARPGSELVLLGEGVQAGALAVAARAALDRLGER
jgi:chemotaxis protein methyltransferase CheR